MYRHLNRFTSRTGATNTHTKAQRKENLPFSAGEPSPRPHSQVNHRPPAAPPVHVSHQQATNAGTSEEEGSASQVERMNREEERAYERRREPRACTKERRGRAPRVSVLCRAGLRPSLRPVSGSTPLREASRKGGVPHS